MADSCVPINHCGVRGPGWLSGGHPSVLDGAVQRKVCFIANSCCGFSVSIAVRNCGGFYVYQLKQLVFCFFRYCGNGSSPTPGKVMA